MSISLPRFLLHLEALAILVAALAFYHQLGASWVLFAVLFLGPDLFMLGYLAGPVFGARVYNLGHTYVLPLAVGVLGFNFGHPLLPAIATIWVAHIGFDRLLGYGLKYPASFKDTHLGRL